jgi:hypothetical protein
MAFAVNCWIVASSDTPTDNTISLGEMRSGAEEEEEEEEDEDDDEEEGV